MEAFTLTFVTHLSANAPLSATGLYVYMLFTRILRLLLLRSADEYCLYHWLQKTEGLCRIRVELCPDL